MSSSAIAKSWRKSFYASAALIALLLISCAHQVPPQGGPIDTEGPKIISTYPAQFTTRFGEKRIVLEFDKYVDQRSVEESIFISPFVGDLEFDWRGTEVEISFSERLRGSTTYVVNVGTDVKDLHNQNRMAQAFTLAFSTGDDIDHGAIQGRIYTQRQGDSPEGVMVFAYQLVNINADTLNSQRTKPDYITQTGKGGDFFFRHLAFGPYRIIAVRDEYRNLLYDPEADEFGVPFRDIKLTPSDTMAAGIWMRLSREDTTKPRLIKATAKDQRHVIAEFSEYIDTSSLKTADVSILDTLSARPLSITSIFPTPGKANSFTLLTDKQDSTAGYRLVVRSASDSAGNQINPIAKSIGFGGSGRSDTVGLRLFMVSIKDSSRQISVSPNIELFLTDAAQRVNPLEFLSLKDSMAQEIPISAQWQNDGAIRVVPQQTLASLMWYKLIIETLKLQDWKSDVARDTTRVFRFETMDADALSGIEGSVVDRNPSDKGKIYIRAESIGREIQVATAVLNQPGPFALSDLKEGKYLISAYRDSNDNGQFDAGKPFPYVQSERFVVYPDTLKLRARWPLEGLKLELK